jgi:hypothetical protein
MATSTLPRHSHDPHSEDVIHALEERGLIDPARHEEAAGVLEAMSAGESPHITTLRRVLAEVAGYVGAAFVVAAVAVFVAPRWLDMSLATRVGLLVGTALVLVAAGLAVGVTGDGIRSLRASAGALRRRLASVLLTGAAVAGASAVVVYLVDWAERGPSSREPYAAAVGFLVLAVLAGLGYVVAPTLIGQAAVAVGLVVGSISTWEVVDEVTTARVAGTVMILGAGWLVLAETRLWREQLPARLIGAALVVGGAQVLLPEHASWAYVLTATVGVAGFVLYAATRAWPYLAMGVVAVTLAVPEALLDWTTGSFGTAAALLGAGVALLVSSLVGLRMRRTQSATGSTSRHRAVRRATASNNQSTPD